MKSATSYSVAAGFALLGVPALFSSAQATGNPAYLSVKPLILAETNGMERRQDRRDDRRDDRDDRQDRREECRDDEGAVGKDKRDCKQRERRKDMIFD